ncbi:hypothetical protein BIU98_02600 [Curtobacterium sp. MMLR14_010]|nr:hypothetical protein BIU98_02600 [Curtobacterium sp. MMLR14_010]
MLVATDGEGATMRSVTDGDGRLVTRVAVTRMVVVTLVTAVVVSVLVGLAPGVGGRAVFFGLSVAGLALALTGFTLRGSIGTRWSSGRQFGGRDGGGRLRRAIRTDSVAGLSEDEQAIAGDYADRFRQGIVITAAQSVGLGLSIGMNQASQMADGSSVEVFNVVLLIAGAGLIVGAVVTGVVQDRQCKRFLEHYERIDPVRV